MFVLFAFPKPISCPPCIPELFPRKKNKWPNKHYRKVYDNVAICMLCLLTFMSYLRTGCLCFHCLSWLKRFPSWDLYFLRYYLKDGLEIIIELCLSPFLCQAETIPIAALLCPQLGPIFDNQHRFGAKLSSFHLQIELLPQI